MVDIAPPACRTRKVSGGETVILEVRVASGAVDAVEGVGFGVCRLWRILVCQPLEPTHNVISHSGPGEAFDETCESGSVNLFFLMTPNCK